MFCKKSTNGLGRGEGGGGQGGESLKIGGMGRQGGGGGESLKIEDKQTSLHGSYSWNRNRCTRLHMFWPWAEEVCGVDKDPHGTMPNMGKLLTMPSMNKGEKMSMRKMCDGKWERMVATSTAIISRNMVSKLNNMQHIPSASSLHHHFHTTTLTSLSS